MALQTTNKFLNDLFNFKSSIYKKDGGVVNSNLYVILNAYAEVFQDVQRILDDIQDDTYLKTANPDSLETNFGSLVDFPKPPRLNTLNNGDEIYRSILRALFDAYLEGATELGMDTGLSTVMSFLIQDTSTDAFTVVDNRALLTYTDSSIQLTYDAVSSSGTFISGTNFSSGDFVISPSGIVDVSSYDPLTRTVSFTGFDQYAASGGSIYLNYAIPPSGQEFSILYNTNHVPFISGNWINFNSPNEVRPLPYDLKTRENTFQNPKFSYWWSNANIVGFNRDGNGIEIIDGALSLQEQALAWRLPSAYITYKDPYDLRTHTSTNQLYDTQGQVYDISGNSNTNIEELQDPIVSDYSSEVSSNPAKYYVRYSANNAYFVSMDKFLGAFNPPVSRRYGYAVFESDNFGVLDFFEMGNNFDENDLFGFGTKHVWTNVAWNQSLGGYAVSNANRFPRPYSLFEDYLFYENFESAEDSIAKFNQNIPFVQISDIIGTPLAPGEDCMQLSQTTSSSADISPIIPSGSMASGNHVQFDFYDPLYPGSSFYLDVNRSNGVNQQTFRFGYDKAVLKPSFSVGISGNSVYDTKSLGYVESYYQNIDEIYYMFPFAQPSASAFVPMESVAGNVNYPSVSNNSLRSLSGTAFTPNLEPEDVLSTDYVKFVWIDDPAENYTIQYSYVRPVFVGSDPVHLAGMPPLASGTFSDGYTYATSYQGINVIPGGYSHFGSTTQPGGLTGGGGVTVYPGFPATRTAGSTWIFESDKSGATTLTYVPTVGSPSSVNGLINLNGAFPEHVLGRVASPGTGPFNALTTADVSYGDKNSISFSAPSGTVINYTFFGSKAKQDLLPSFVEKGDYIYPSYYYQEVSGTALPIDLTAKNYLPVVRDSSWYTLSYEMGADFDKTVAYLNQLNFINSSALISGAANVGSLISPNNSNNISLIYNSTNPSEESSFIDNFLVGFRTPGETRPFYNYKSDIQKNWQGAFLDQSAIVGNRQFAGTNQGDFTFSVVVRGLEQRYVFIIKDIIQKLKPAHTLVNYEFEIDHELNTTELIFGPTDSRNWERGNVSYNTVVESELDVNDPLDLPGDITISGSTIH